MLALVFQRGLMGGVVFEVPEERTELVGVLDIARDGPRCPDTVSRRDAVNDLRGMLLETVLIGRLEYRRFTGSADLELELLT